MCRAITTWGVSKERLRRERWNLQGPHTSGARALGDTVGTPGAGWRNNTPVCRGGGPPRQQRGLGSLGKGSPCPRAGGRRSEGPSRDGTGPRERQDPRGLGRGAGGRV